MSASCSLGVDDQLQMRRLMHSTLTNAEVAVRWRTDPHKIRLSGQFKKTSSSHALLTRFSRTSYHSLCQFNLYLLKFSPELRV